LGATRCGYSIATRDIDDIAPKTSECFSTFCLQHSKRSMSAPVKPDPAAAGEAGDAEHINLRVNDPQGNEVFFKIKKTTQLKKLMDAYTQRQGLQPGAVRFLFDGNRLEPTSTPLELDMADNDVIGT
jgi:small ubiquitin-related modifier